MTDDLFLPEKNCWRRETAGRFGWVIDGEDYFRALRAAFSKARREILIVGWDIDSKLQLIRDSDHPDYPSPLAATLDALIEANPELEVRVLAWDFSMIYVLEREWFPAQKFGWQTSDRLHFCLDDTHETAASHHQKIVVIDGVLAFNGGLDLTKVRWDTREHLVDDPRRIDPNGNSYGPFHDVQAVVTGDAAAALRELVRDRWRAATGDDLPQLEASAAAEIDDLWPDGIPVRMEKAPVAIARTSTRPDRDASVREIEQLYMDMIDIARHAIYIENQYFTSRSITARLARSLRKKEGPDVVIVLPPSSSGWLEQATMDVLRAKAINHLREADAHGRLQVYEPTLGDGVETEIKIHGKIMVVDERWIRIGSANLSNRSMGLDSECDLVIDATGTDAADLFRADLLAEQVGAPLDDVRERIRTDGLGTAVARYVENREPGCRGLVPVQAETADWQTEMETVIGIADPDSPFAWETPILAEESSGDPSGKSRDAAPGGAFASDDAGASGGRRFLRLRRIARIAGALLIAGLVGWGIWATRGDSGIDPQALLERLRSAASHPLAPLLIIPAHVLGSLVLAPLTWLVALFALVFDPWVAAIGNTVGATAATALNHWIGSKLGSGVLDRLPGRIVNPLRRMAGGADLVSLIGLRLLPIAPFGIVNAVVGALHIPMRTFLLATVIVIVPGIVLVSLSVDRARAALAGEPVFDPVIIGAVVLAGIALVGTRVYFRRRGRSDDD